MFALGACTLLGAASPSQGANDEEAADARCGPRGDRGPAASQAQDSKWILGFRLGYAPAMGDATGDQQMKDAIPSQIPLQLDVLYKFTPEWAAGVYLSYGFGQLSSAEADACDALGVDCSMSTLRLGVQGTYTFVTANQFVPWLGLGFGYEGATEKAVLNGASASQSTDGWEFLNLQVGGDYKVNPKFAIGPYVMLQVGQYSSIEGNSISNKGTHEWLNVGIRGKFDL
jgi:outer membrane protein W